MDIKNILYIILKGIEQDKRNTHNNNGKYGFK